MGEPRDRRGDEHHHDDEDLNGPVPGDAADHRISPVCSGRPAFAIGPVFSVDAVYYVGAVLSEDTDSAAW
ncbi:hypothetical protein GP2_023_00090 [Gordonia paraffinivorans NBRC 108238]|uniref:Uncharacterized protein n=1 Tax=Gordonia paraffinivorans NBRC 108238 TaxID=1223543 RepID=A0ABQ0INF0_9ACTN|nr:hypothetical protein GP2_023_00090 [Gordonia paraffinivorans NBRC 108238]